MNLTKLNKQTVDRTLPPKYKFLLNQNETILLKLCKNYGKSQNINRTSKLTMKLIKVTWKISDLCEL